MWIARLLLAVDFIDRFERYYITYAYRKHLGEQERVSMFYYYQGFSRSMDVLSMAEFRKLDLSPIESKAE